MSISRLPVVTVVFSAIICFCLVATLDAGISRESTKSFSVTPGGELIVDSDIGTVEIYSHDKPVVEVKLTLEADTRSEDKAERMFADFEVDYEQDGNDIYVYGEFYGRKKSWRFWESNRSSLRVTFTIGVPKEYDITVETSGGSIYVDDLKGVVHAKTSGGSLSFERIDGPVKGMTSGGSITLASCTAEAELKTSGGSIRIGHVAGDVYARTSGGSIIVDEVMGTIDAATSGGGIEARISQQPKSDCRLVTSGGSIRVDLDEGIDLTVDAKTSGGRVRTDFPVTLSGDLSKSRLQADINEGGPELYLRTSGGNIRLSRL